MAAPLPKVPRLRNGIVAVLINEAGLVLMAERSDALGSWQFPQGGVENGESETQAFFRELGEELGNDSCEILKTGAHKIAYLWPKPGRDYDGQDQTWFLARFRMGEEPHLAESDGCFRAWKWEDPAKVLEQTLDWKRAAFREGLVLLGLIEESG